LKLLSRLWPFLHLSAAAWLSGGLVEPESYTEIAADADRIVEHVLTKTRPGSIILLHVMAESRTESRKAIPGIIQGLLEQGYSFVTVSELLAMP